MSKQSGKQPEPEPEQQAEPEQQKQGDPEPEQQPDESTGHTVITEGDVDLPVPSLEQPEPFLEGADPPKEELSDPVMPFTGDDEAEGKHSK